MPVFAQELADLVQALRPTAELAAGDEFDGRLIFIDHAVLANLQTQPAQAGFEPDVGRSGARVPGVAQVVSVLEHERAVA